MSCLPGVVLEQKSLTAELANEIGVLLAKIHLNRTDAFGDLTKDESMVRDPRIYFSDKFEESFSECLGHLPDEILRKCSDCFKDKRDLLLSVDGPCIIHRDFRPGNILINKGKVSGVIDWASGRSGFAEDDLCPLEMGEWGDNKNIKEAFLKGYATIRPAPDYSAIMPLLLLNRAIAAIGFTVKIGTWDNRDAELYQRNRIIMQQILE